MEAASARMTIEEGGREGKRAGEEGRTKRGRSLRGTKQVGGRRLVLVDFVRI